MPKQKQPATFRPTEHDESIGNPPVHKGKHAERDTRVSGKGSTKAGLNRASGPRQGRKDGRHGGTGRGPR